ncbi:heavy-metal-associated domain-containing protein [Wenyingzhuangia sp. chi5]|uniref:Heavy-metal-associated domain-containing protein n=1 Tax=Wenyingzhuangia gilva TaxID=3057677 RepID=A0ABT8VQ07_9FLAO|nr:heavy-metal-associated domain-containing protein [Wenyingzhuangia sp. chi5]MDO3694059.1 heavy-metal-associated domain-containing protein [Wenyingzhuangia sp. chi5]
MKITSKYLCIAFLAFITLSACKPSDQKNTTEQTVLPVKLQTASLDIEGMTCEIGCAKTIESKISKVDGVTVSKVDFTAKKGTFTYDANKTSEANIINTINGLLDGKTYKATVEKTCCTNKETKTCTQACADKCGHKVGEVCERCSDKEQACCAVEKLKDCSKECAEKCHHKEGESCNQSTGKNEACKTGSEKLCCSAKSK